jgi:hypothetical protein
MLPILVRQARDIVEAQFTPAAEPRGPAARAAARPTERPATAPVRTAGARMLRALADRLEPCGDARPRSA